MDFDFDNNQGFIALRLPVLPGSVDFKNYELLLKKIDQIMIQSGLEAKLQEVAITQATVNSDDLAKLDVLKIKRNTSYALRCNIARCLSQESYRDFSVHLADSILLRKFCGYDTPFAPKMTPSKSTLQRFEMEFDAETVRMITDLATYAAADVDSALHGVGGLVNAIDTEVWLLDSTCAKLDIHFPVDWVLLKDCVKSIMQTIIEIRKHGIQHRIGRPEKFISDINKLSMQMTHQAKGPGSKKKRKATFRKMRKLLLRVAQHGERYSEKLEEHWGESDLSEANKERILSKFKHTLDLVPSVIHQAYERIVGERKVKNKDKILSIHETHSKVYNRGKSGAQVEFGLQLVLGESLDGIITHCELLNEAPRHDTKHLGDILEHRSACAPLLQPDVIVADRGFFSATNEKIIAKAGMQSNICPIDPKDLKQRLGEEKFADLAKRRAQTEARIGILTNNFFGRKLTAKGYANR